MTERPIAALILAAGKGTRMRSALPKVLHPLLGRPMLDYPLCAVAALGAVQTVVVVGYGAEAVEQAFGGRAGLTFVLQAEQLGTGHAARMGEPALAEFDGDVVILPGDAPTIRASTLQKLLEFHRKEASTCTVLTTRLEDAAHYGRIVRDADGSVARIVEAKDATAEERALKEINSGVYVVDARFLFAALRRVGNQNAQREYYLTDIVGLSRVDGLKPRAFLHLDSGELEGVNDRAELSRAESRLRLDANTALQKAGVTLVDPASTFVEPGCRVEADAWIDPQVQLRGKTCVEAGARVGTGTILRDVLVGAGAQLGPYCVLEAVSIAPGAVLPPFSGRISA